MSSRIYATKSLLTISLILISFLIESVIHGMERDESINSGYRTKIQSAETLIEVRAHFRAAFSKWERMLFQAAALGDAQSVILSLEKIKDVNIKDKNENTALHIAARYGHAHIVRILIDRGAKINVTNVYHRFRTSHDRGEWDHLYARHYTPLHEAAERGHVEVVMALLDAGADASQECYTGTSRSTKSGGTIPLDWAASNGHVEVVRKLLDISTQDINSHWHALRMAISRGHLAVVTEFLDRGMDVNLRYGHFLHHAAAGDSIAIVQELLTRGAEINRHNRNHATPLFVAVRHNRPEIAQEFIMQNADAHIRADSARTVLHEAASNGLTEIMRELILRGADVRPVILQAEHLFILQQQLTR